MDTMAPDVEELIKRVNTLTLDKNRLRQRLNQLTSNQSGGNNSSTFQQQSSRESSLESSSNVIAGVECTSSSERDILYMNELYRKRLDEYNDNWEYLQSKCSALLSELNALQKAQARLRRENEELEERLKIKCDENDLIRSELQTVVLNYETQLSAMSEHLSAITRQISLDDSKSHVGSIENPNYVE